MSDACELKKTGRSFFFFSKTTDNDIETYTDCVRSKVDITTDNIKAVSSYGLCETNDGINHWHLKLDQTGTNCAATCPTDGVTDKATHWECPSDANNGITFELTTGCVTKQPHCPKPT